MHTRLKNFAKKYPLVVLGVLLICGVAIANLTSHTEALLDTLLLNLDSDADGAISDETWYTTFDGKGDITSVLGDSAGPVPLLFQDASAFTGADTTPDVSTSMHWITADTTTYTDFDGTPVDGQQLWIYCAHAATFDLTTSGIEAWNRSTDLTVTVGYVAVLVFEDSDNQWHFVNAPDEAETLADPNADRVLIWDDSAGTWAFATVANGVEISSINYSTNTITLASEMTWSNDDGVWLYKKSNGSIVLTGTNTDQGAYEYGVAASASPVRVRVSSGGTPVVGGVTFAVE